jgi:hypothetical protein
LLVFFGAGQPGAQNFINRIPARSGYAYLGADCDLVSERVSIILGALGLAIAARLKRTNNGSAKGVDNMKMESMRKALLILIPAFLGLLAIAVVYLKSSTARYEDIHDESLEILPNYKIDFHSSAWPNSNLEFNGRFPKFPRKLMVYKAIHPEVTEDYVRELGQKTFDIPRTAILAGSKSSWDFQWGSERFNAYVQPYWFQIERVRPSGFEVRDQSGPYPGREEYKRIATDYLKERSLLPEDVYLWGVTDRGVGTVTVSYVRRIDGYRCLGGEIKIDVGPDGIIRRITSNYQKLIPYKPYPIKTAKETFKQLTKMRSPSWLSKFTVKKISLLYVSKYQEYVEPVYCFRYGKGSGDWGLLPAIKDQYLQSEEEINREYRRRMSNP